MKRICCSILAASAACLAAGTAGAEGFGAAKPGNRAGYWEAYGGARYVFSETLDFDGGASIKSDDDMGFAFGLGYNLDSHWLVGGEVGWSSVGYEGVVVSADTPGATARVSGEFDAFSLAASLTYHFIDGPLTPYVGANLGYTWIDSNIADGPPRYGCWYDPWYWYPVCGYFTESRTSEGFGFGLSAGLRWEFARGGFLRAGYAERWIDIDGASGTPGFGGIHFDIGSKF